MSPSPKHHHELIEVVDANDTVIKTEQRYIVHQQGLRHRAVHILVFNQIGQIFLQKRALSKDINPGLWDTSAAGHIDAGESYYTAAIRETQEELGVEVEHSLKLLFKLPAQDKTGMEFIEVYRCLHEGPFQLEAREISTGKWFDISEISKRTLKNDPQLTETFKLLWSTALNQNIFP